MVDFNSCSCLVEQTEKIIGHLQATAFAHDTLAPNGHRAAVCAEAVAEKSLCAGWRWRERKANNIED